MATELEALEREGWRALQGPGGATWYEDRLAEDALMVFPFGVLDRGQALAAMREGPPWAAVRFGHLTTVPLGADGGIVTYDVEAERTGQPVFRARVTSAYRREEGGWRMVLHQQMPTG